MAPPLSLYKHHHTPPAVAFSPPSIAHAHLNFSHQTYPIILNFKLRAPKQFFKFLPHSDSQSVEYSATAPILSPQSIKRKCRPVACTAGKRKRARTFRVQRTRRNVKFATRTLGRMILAIGARVARSHVAARIARMRHRHKLPMDRRQLSKSPDHLEVAIVSFNRKYLSSSSNTLSTSLVHATNPSPIVF